MFWGILLVFNQSGLRIDYFPLLEFSIMCIENCHQPFHDSYVSMAFNVASLFIYSINSHVNLKYII
jgi:hypothetical protein